MARVKLTAEEWETFLSLAERLEIPVRELLDRKARFTELESAGARPDDGGWSAGPDRIGGSLPGLSPGFFSLSVWSWD